MGITLTHKILVVVEDPILLKRAQWSTVVLVVERSTLRHLLRFKSAGILILNIKLLQFLEIYRHVSADGNPGSAYQNVTSGGGSGGSIFISAPFIIGTGLLSAVRCDTFIFIPYT